MLMEVGVPGKDLKVLCVIPARYNSSRFKGKPLALIKGVPMIKRTYMQSVKSKLLDLVVVATDDNRIFDYCISENIEVVMTSDKCLTGTDRLAELIQKKEFSEYDFYINVQGDEPIIDPIAIDQLVDMYKKYGNYYIAYNLYKMIDQTEKINSKTIIKVIVNQNDELMYMSRLPVPYSNSNLHPIHKMQVPVYGYTSRALELFSQNQKTINEKFEDIELLRFSDLGYKVKMLMTNITSIAVDVPDDVKKVELFIN
jgi:3-deoxy-manno-octulosonate cytidylyltransferase (CMP-KDO synthetase)